MDLRHIGLRSIIHWKCKRTSLSGFLSLSLSLSLVLCTGRGDLHSYGDEEFPDLPVGVSLHGLTKIYGDRKAIENLNLTFYEGHVTALLGHNGAGKTTTM